MKWISVEDRLPEANKPIGMMRIEQHGAYYYSGEMDADGDFTTSPEGMYMTGQITHWCDWPELPT